MKARYSIAYAPAAISNFFAIQDEPLRKGDYSDLLHAGATGGGFTLSKGVYSRATLLSGSSSERVRITVNGDRNYNAQTTRKALEVLSVVAGVRLKSLRIDQRVEVPIGYGFGASAASALSAVMASASATGLGLSRSRVAYAAHAAEIICGTGLGTVSAIFRSTGAGAITRAGAPGVARFRRVRVPRDMRIVTASIAPYPKTDVLSSAPMRRKVNKLGEKALAEFESNPTLKTLAMSGESFAKELGLESAGVRSMIHLAKRSGAIWASQNMIGHAIHCLVGEMDVERVASSLAKSSYRPVVGIFEFGKGRSRVLG